MANVIKRKVLCATEGEYKLVELLAGKKSLTLSSKVEIVPTPLPRNSIPEQDFPDDSPVCSAWSNVC